MFFFLISIIKKNLCDRLRVWQLGTHFNSTYSSNNKKCTKIHLNVSFIFLIQIFHGLTQYFIHCGICDVGGYIIYIFIPIWSTRHTYIHSTVSQRNCTPSPPNSIMGSLKYYSTTQHRFAKRLEGILSFNMLFSCIYQNLNKYEGGGIGIPSFEPHTNQEIPYAKPLL